MLVQVHVHSCVQVTVLIVFGILPAESFFAVLPSLADIVTQWHQPSHLFRSVFMHTWNRKTTFRALSWNM